MARSKILLVTAALSVGLAPTASMADHVNPVPDALDCAKSAAPGFGAVADPDQSDRGATCLSDGYAANGPEYYVGGEAETEHGYPGEDHQAGDPCGAVVVGGEVLSATRSDDPSTAVDERLDWDWIHVHVRPNGTKVNHHHTCD